MEPRRSQRTLAVLKKSKTSANGRPTTSGTKRKVSTSDAGNTTQSSKRAAFGDITNRKLGNIPKISKTAQKKLALSSSAESEEIVIVSQASSLSSQGSLNRQSSQNRNGKEQTCDTTDVLPVPLSSIQSSRTESATSTLLHILAPAPPHQRTDLKYTDIDLENRNDTFQSPEYAQDIFNYYKNIETEFLVDDYMPRQTEVTPAMRSVLVDWLVEVQENFELNHETLYLATRLVDHYLMKHNVGKEALQLVGAASIFIGCKFDERIPPLVDDFLYICDDAYNRAEFVRMEKDILRTVDFRLGMPISYRFLRRFAKAGKKTMSVLTLSRYINETALMSYKLITHKESLIAAGCLRLAMFMSEPDNEWDDTLIYYSGYEEKDLKEMVILLNTIMHGKNASLRTVENKYSHPVFFEVAKQPLIPVDGLYADDPTSISDITSTITEAILV